MIRQAQRALELQLGSSLFQFHVCVRVVESRTTRRESNFVCSAISCCAAMFSRAKERKQINGTSNSPIDFLSAHNQSRTVTYTEKAANVHKKS